MRTTLPHIVWLAPSLWRRSWPFFLLEKNQQTTTSSMLIFLFASLFKRLPYPWHGCSDKRARTRCNRMSVDGAADTSPATSVSAHHRCRFATVLLPILEKRQQLPGATSTVFAVAFLWGRQHPFVWQRVFASRTSSLLPRAHTCTV